MDPQRFQRAAELFLRSRSLGLSERDEYLAKECGADGDLRASVEGLIAGAEQQLPFAELAAELGGALAPLGADGAPSPDSRIGPYRLLEKLGEGGFGVVYMAEQTEPVRRKVALKIVRQGLDTKKVIARFEAERQALAMMDHANITRVLDAGATQHGRPYFVMELIRGLPITQFCDKHQLDARARLELMLPVCHAVQHAHHKGIIHRDLKPSNVLVTQHDNTPVPKVIDFGIAKALHAPLTDRTVFTEFRQVMGTPEYMSPEQAETSATDVDTRTDVFSLGVLLYELLTGTTPLDSDTLRKADYGELQRLLRETDPPTPSRRLVTLCTQGGDAPARPTTRAFEIAKARGSDPASLGRQLRGELDWIVMKCLEKDRRRRYESASALAEDLRRHLANEPVLAAAPSTWYRLRKLAQRHRVLVAFVATLVLAIGVAFAGVSWGLMKVMGERDRAMVAHDAALRNSRESQALTDVLRDMLRVAGPRGLRDATYSVQQMLMDFEADLGKRLIEHPEQEVQVRLVLGEVLEAAGRARQFVQQLELAANRARQVQEPNNRILPSALEYLAYARVQHSRAFEAISLAEEAIALRRSRGGDDNLAWNMLAMARSQLGQHEAAIAASERAVSSALEADGERSAEFAITTTTYASTLLIGGRVDAALRAYPRAVELRAAAFGSEHQSVRVSRAQAAIARAWSGDLDAAEAEVVALTRLQAELGTKRDNAQAAIGSARVACALARGRFDQAIAAQRELVDTDRVMRAEDEPQSMRDRVDLAELLLQCGRADEATTIAAAEQARLVRLPPTTIAFRIRAVLAGCKRELGDAAGAIVEFEALLAEQRQQADADSPLLAVTMEGLAEALFDRREFARATKLAADAAAIRAKHPLPQWRLVYARTLAALARASRDARGADAEFAGEWRRLESEPALLPSQRTRLAAAARAFAAAPTTR